jgi:uncharacterized protein YbbK (DUF523 family)
MGDESATHPAGFDWSRLSSVTIDDPLRVMFSACLLGHETGWEGGAYTDALAVRLAGLPRVRRIHFCPEHATLGTPRALTTLYDGHGRDVLAGRARVLETTGRDVTRELVAGADAMLAAARAGGAELAVLMDVSDSCGSHAVYLGAPADRRYQRGPGVAAATLMDAGIPVLAQRDHATLQRLVAALDPTFAVDPAASDFVDHPWYRDYFADGPVGAPLAEYEAARSGREG